MKWKYVIGWLPMVLIAVFNGALREMLYKPSLGDLRAHQLSTVLAVIVFGFYIWFLLRHWNVESFRESLRIGLVWLLLTVVFELGFGRFVMGRPWETLLHDYNLSEGRIWIAVLLWVAIAPLVFYRFQRRPREEQIKGEYDHLS